MSKFEIAISTLLIGFFIGQTTDFLKYKYITYRKKKALKTEIDDIASEFQEKITRIQSTVASLKEPYIGTTTPEKIYKIIYSKHYADIAPYFNSIERKTINNIYSQVDNFNSKNIIGNFDNIATAKKTFFALYANSKLGYESANHFKNSKGNFLLTDDKSKLEAVNAEIQEFAIVCGITS